MLGVGGVSVRPASRGGGSCGPVPIATSLAWSGGKRPPLACREYGLARLLLSALCHVDRPQLHACMSAAAPQPFAAQGPLRWFDLCPLQICLVLD